ncbi:unnamed protein product [Linum trigynum]|uniref:Secreted protein n=1 Tax=Linum trigynum TaxID=586398 RepID=A0AAV2E4Q3_9ROSI
MFGMFLSSLWQLFALAGRFFLAALLELLAISLQNHDTARCHGFAAWNHLQRSIPAPEILRERSATHCKNVQSMKLGDGSSERIQRSQTL